jgi:hypothetical protein
MLRLTQHQQHHHAAAAGSFSHAIFCVYRHKCGEEIWSSPKASPEAASGMPGAMTGGAAASGDVGDGEGGGGEDDALDAPPLLRRLLLVLRLFFRLRGRRFDLLRSILLRERLVFLRPYFLEPPFISLHLLGII